MIVLISLYFLHAFPVVGLYNLERNNLFCRFDGDIGGVTQVTFSSCGTKLFSGSRKVVLVVMLLKDMPVNVEMENL